MRNLINKALIFFILNFEIFADVQGSVDRSTKGLQRLGIAVATLLLVFIGYQYKRGKPEAKQMLEQWFFGFFIVVGATSIVGLIQGWIK